MSNVRRILILIVLLALPLAMVGIAMGIPEGACESGDPKWDDHPACTSTTTTTPSSTTTAPTPPAFPGGMSFEEAVNYIDPNWRVPADTVIRWEPEYGSTLWNVTLTPDEPWVHIDLWNTDPGVITITVTDPGRAGQLVANVRDSHPGDVCMVQHLGLRKGQRVMTLPGADDEVDAIPPATINACGTGFSEADFDENCEENCEIIAQNWDQIDETDPLAMAVTYSSGPAATVVLNITFNEPPEP